MVLVINDIASLRTARSQSSGRVGLVPTMGALHAGHLALVQQARQENDSVFVSIFVNPTQFAPNEDYASYPRDLAHDLALLESLGVDYVFTPTPELMYPAGFQTYLTVERVSAGLEGDRRPGHFRGVATVVAKFFNLVQPHAAYFGQKDAQQVVVIRRMAHDMNFPVDVVVCPTVREADGLAMSSRNVYLTAEERAAAPVIYRSLCAAAAAYDAGERRPERLRLTALDVLGTQPLARVEYVALNDPRTLVGVHKPTDEPLLLSMVVRIGKPRLLDNCLLPGVLNDREGLNAVLGA